MRALAVCALLVAGCPGSAPYQPITSNYTDGGCQISCGAVCPGTSLCVPWPYVPSCQATCQTTGDCSTGLLCVQLTTPGLPPNMQPVCVSAKLAVCGGDRACPSLTAKCRDAQTLMRPLTAATNFCGYELINCNNGCDATAARCN